MRKKRGLKRETNSFIGADVHMAKSSKRNPLHPYARAWLRRCGDCFGSFFALVPAVFYGQPWESLDSRVSPKNDIGIRAHNPHSTDDVCYIFAECKFFAGGIAFN